MAILLKVSIYCLQIVPIHFHYVKFKIKGENRVITTSSVPIELHSNCRPHKVSRVPFSSPSCSPVDFDPFRFCLFWKEWLFFLSQEHKLIMWRRPTSHLNLFVVAQHGIGVKRTLWWNAGGFSTLSPGPTGCALLGARNPINEPDKWKLAERSAPPYPHPQLRSSS